MTPSPTLVINWLESLSDSLKLILYNLSTVLYISRREGAMVAGSLEEYEDGAGSLGM